jgi:hypothetical protein
MTGSEGKEQRGRSGQYTWIGFIRKHGERTNKQAWMPMEMRWSTRMETNIADFPIRQLQGRIPLPTEEEPPKDRMDPGLQEVRQLEEDGLNYS